MSVPRFSAKVFILTLGVVSLSGAPKQANLSLKDLHGQRVRLRDYRGKPVVLNFWATWCGPCKAELPLLVEAEKNYGPSGVVIITVSLDDQKTRKFVPIFLAERNLTLPVWMGADLYELEKFGLGEALPSTAFIDSEGYIVARVLGQIRPEELKGRIEWMTGIRLGPTPDPLIKHLSN
jgi:thiol-disulfide isomerase/thioredoxin